MKKVLPLFLAVLLVFGVVGAQAADVSVGTELLSQEGFVRLGVKEFHGQVRLGENPNTTEDATVVKGFSLGIRRKTSTPFYGLGQVNWKAFDSKNDGDVAYDSYKYDSLGIGGGAVFDALFGVDLGGEVTFYNPNPFDIYNYEPNIRVFVRLDFKGLPTPSE